MTAKPTRRLHQAIDAAARIHDGQYRKDPDVRTPYVAHCYGVAALLAAHDFDEDVVIAGLLHDVFEDRPEHATEVRQFGDRVVELVDWVTEQKQDAAGDDVPWAQRKAAYTKRIRIAPPEAKALCCADKIHNLESLLLTIGRGADPWPAMNARADVQLQRLAKLRAALADNWSNPLLNRFDELFAELRITVEP